MESNAPVWGRAAASRRHGMVALLCVLAIHGLLYVWLRSSAGWRPRDLQPAPALVTLRLLPWSTPAPTEPAPEPPPEAKPVKRPVAAFGPVAAPAIPRVADAPVSAPASINGEASIAAAAGPASQASQPPLLNLVLPPAFDRRAVVRNPAVDDPRGNTARTTPEQRMANSLDTRVIEEDLGNGRRRIRRGDDCVIVKQSRIGQLMPFNDAAARSPSLVSTCP